MIPPAKILRRGRRSWHTSGARLPNTDHSNAAVSPACHLRNETEITGVGLTTSDRDNVGSR
jgi:hypothetical protein